MMKRKKKIYFDKNKKKEKQKKIKEIKCQSIPKKVTKVL